MIHDPINARETRPSKEAMMLGLSNPLCTNAIDLLTRDHQEVIELFDRYETALRDGDTRSKELLAAEICDALHVHAQVDEELFYPAIRRGVKDASTLVDEAAVEHQSLKDVIQRLEAAAVKDPLFDAGVRVLGEYLKHHVHAEETGIFPKARCSTLDLDALGARMAQRREELRAAGGDPETDSGPDPVDGPPGASRQSRAETLWRGGVAMRRWGVGKGSRE